MKFLTARWSHLILMNYAVDPALLERRLPRGTRVDLLDGRAFVSLVAFHFEDTRVLGVPWPGFRNFTEVNLRFYVRAARDRGVVFARELVPQRFVAAVARAVYNEPYSAVPMSGAIRRRPGVVDVSHRLDFPFGTQRIRVRADDTPSTPPPTSDAHWFKEHHWGFNRDHFGRTIRYEVEHPTWQVYPVREYKLQWDWARVYGREWRHLGETQPHSVLLAKGSRVSVSIQSAI
jgi:uncharacterized protein YqjF (DUF2071 family)